MIREVEHNSPAQQSGLREKDVIRKINNISTDNMSYEKFIEIIGISNELIFHIQTLDDYTRTHPEAVPKETRAPPPNKNADQRKPVPNERKSFLPKSLTKLLSR